MKVIAISGDRELVDLGNGQAAVRERDDDLLGPTKSIAAWLKLGYWELVTPSQ